MSTFVVTMLLGWFLSAFGWMALVAIAATLLAYVFKGKKGAILVAVLSVAALIGWRSFARSGWANTGRQGRQLTAKELRDAKRKQQWKKYNKGGEEEVNKTAAQFAMQTNAMGGMDGGMALPMPNVQTPNLRPPNFGPAQSGPLFRGTPGQVTVAFSQAAPMAAAAPTAAPPATAPQPMPAASAEGEAQAMTGATTLPVAIAGVDARDKADAKAKAASPGGNDAAPSADKPNALQKGAAAGGKPATAGSSADSASAAGKPRTPALAKASQAAGQGAQSSRPSDKRPAGTQQPAMVGSGKQGAIRGNRPSPQGNGHSGGTGLHADALPRRHRPRYQPTGEDSLQPGRSGQQNAAHGQNSMGGNPRTNGKQAHATPHRPRYQNTEQFVNPTMPGSNGNHFMNGVGGMGHGGMGGHPMGGGFGPMHGGGMTGHGGGHR
jgi:hypothetical protein